MSLAPHTRVGPYEILSLIGAGGMGEVYKARDTRLDRTVAIKVLSGDLSADPERRIRFSREARTIAALHHARICTLFDVGEHRGATFLVMEHLEGETLAERLRKTALPIDAALAIAAEIADALAVAHRHGIIHRDLKPANVMMTDGGVKLLDFGLAKAAPPAQPLGPMASVVTQSAPVTTDGVIVGTLQYMAPEQIEGRSADARSDVWALGVTLYQMLTGKYPFAGTSGAAVIGNILKSEPPAVSAVQAHASAAVERLVRRCLAKDPDARWQNAADLADELRWVKDNPVAASPTAGRGRRTRVVAVVAAATLLSAAAGAGLGWRLLPAPPASGVVRTTIALDKGHWLDGVRRAEDLERPSRHAVAISPDGSYVVYSASEARGTPRLFMRRLDRSTAAPIPGTERGVAPFISPDGRWVGFWADGKLKKIPVEGGVATPLCDIGVPFGASWGRNDIIVVAMVAGGGLSAVPADGGALEAWTTPDPQRDESGHRLPSWLPDGTGVLFTVMRHGYDAHPRIAVMRADTREWRILVEDAADARYLATGHLVFLRQGTLMAVRFDPASQEIVGRPVALVEGVMQAFSPAFNTNTAAGQFAVSDTGALVYATGGVAPDIRNSLVWVDHAGVEAPAAALPFSFFAPRLSPDGRKIVYIFYGQERHLWVYDLERGTNIKLHDRGMGSYPSWFPDGRRILFGWQASVRINVYRQAADGGAPMERVTTSECDQRVGSWSADGDTVAVVQSCTGSSWDIAVLSASSGRVTPLIASPSDEMFPEFSPDGRWIAYTSNETKRDEVYVQRFRGQGRYQISTGGGVQPLWSRDGKRLFYRWQNQMWAAEVDTAEGFSTGRPRLLFERSGYSLGAPIRGYDLSRDSRRFLMVKLDQRTPSPATELALVQNWVEELTSTVPSGR